MHIRSVILSGNKRLMLNNINVFRYTPTSLYQLILGTNGSGKSTVLRECSPLPAVSTDYISGGSKVIEIEENGEVYILTSTMKGSGHHSFIKTLNGSVVGGEELNPGKTGKVQKELVKQIFRYTPELHALLTGEIKFTSMSPAKRREWITDISDLNLDYALGVYDRLKTKTRDTSGALKHIKGRLTTETSKLLDYKDTEDLEKRGSRLREELDLLFQSQRRDTDTAHVLKDSIMAELNNYESLCTEIVKTDLTRPHGIHVNSFEALREVLEHYNTERVVLNTTLERDQVELDNLQTVVKALNEGEGSIDPVVLGKMLSDKVKEYNALTGKLGNFQVTADATEVLMNTKEALPQLVEVFQQIPDNSEGVFTGERVRGLQEELDTLRKSIDKVTNQQARVVARYEHITHSKDTTCPSCTHTWKDGVEPGEVKRLECEIVEYDVKLEGLRANRVAVEANLDEFSTYREIYGRYRSIVNAYPRLAPLWDFIQENRTITHHPKNNISVLYGWEKDVQISVELTGLREELDAITQEINRAKAVEGVDAQYSRTRYQTLQVSIESNIQAVENLRQRITSVKNYERALERVQQCYEKATSCLDKIEALITQCTDAYRQQHIANLVYGHQGTLSIVEKKIREKATQTDIVNDLTNSEVELAEATEALKVLLSDMSPTDGFIAEQLKGFIECLVGQMNDIIEQIWTYDFRILPCGSDNDDLDYYFPVMVKNEYVSDVRLGSTGQVEIVNFAFQLVVMSQLGMNHHPLLLDELGSGFDEQHRVNLMVYVKALVDARCHSQMFLINHHSAQWGIFTGAEICVLDASNITVPQTHNKHVELL